jgi:predicted transcriptional regulator
MTTHHSKHCISLRLVPELVDRIDNIRDVLCLDRTSWIRRAIRRQLEFSESQELPLIDNRIQQAIHP